MPTSTSFLAAHQPSNASTARRYATIKPLITKREREVLHLIAHEHSAKEIAVILYVSYETINSHRKNIMTKLDVKNTAGMIRVAFERGLLPIPNALLSTIQ